ncbi:hypothetical protein ASPZODRAFT_1004338 [Penicilliopsis zonata CBS 506.65]|uniref:Uncharacterized protein n=1 Tax=Penicilliopsis zonata CBS 506.65 TaxID=1073090 RepID=A0A1L9SRE5_9EURO|nr:hypothetical protein ASPZODRAFT_1004338 [Penicilliopsis zonata CBS 506.65]OJJ49694.1 hypothetical protein ASPZODRAFT_1004338 [Penicilliopsis zonata CBS 506.65]
MIFSLFIINSSLLYILGDVHSAVSSVLYLDERAFINLSLSLSFLPPMESGCHFWMDGLFIFWTCIWTQDSGNVWFLHTWFQSLPCIYRLIYNASHRYSVAKSEL